MAVVYKGPVFSVEVETVALPDGRPHEVSTVRHAPSVVIIPVTDDGRVILIRQHRHSVGQDLWEFPAGSSDPGESMEDAARRECEEEIAMVPEKLERLHSMFPAPGFCDERLTFFRVSSLRASAPDSPHKPDEDEDIHAETFTLDDATAMVRRGDIVDLKTAYGLTLL
jgi:ADP-ribose pyrophosphatase